MTMLIAASLVFLATHFVPSTPLRAALVRAIGEKAYLGLYSVVALAGLVWMIAAYNRAPRELLWSGPREAALVLVPLSLVLIICGYWRNPTMVGAGKLMKSDDPARGIIRITRHPLMWGVMLWAIGHLVARGTLAGVVFFGTFLALAALGTLLLDHRKSKTQPEDWKRFGAVTSNIPFVAIAQGRNRMAWQEIGWLRPAIGLAAATGFFFAHAWLFGVPA